MSSYNVSPTEPESQGNASEATGAALPVLFAVRALPIEAFGDRHGRHTRKLALLMLATYANADGTNCFPSVSKLAENCGLQKRSVQKILRWLREHGFLRIEYKAGPSQSNFYVVMLPQIVNSGVHDVFQSSSCPEAHRVVNSGVHEGGERKHTGSELQSSPNLPIDLPITTRRPTKKARAPKNVATPFVLPDWIPVGIWAAYEEMRKKKRSPMTDYARRLIVDDLAQLRDAGDSPVDVLKQSIARGWTGVFALNGDYGSRKPSSERIEKLQILRKPVERAN